MKKSGLQQLATDQLVDRFAEIGIAQYAALINSRISTFRTLFEEMNAIDDELKRRGREARLALLRLYDHPNVQVRLKAAIRTVAVAPDPAKRLLQAIRDSRRYPQAADAVRLLRSLEDGSFIPS